MALQYIGMTAPEAAALDRAKTVFFMPVSPIEVHGPHLPLGTDVMIAQEVQGRVEAQIAQDHPDVVLVELPPLYCGSDALPAPGSISVQAGGLSSVLYDYARALSGQGCQYLVISDNHGGPRHHLGINAAARKAWKRHRFYLIDPFIEIFRRMVALDPELLAGTSLSPGSCGDDSDSHAGTNETSLVLAIGGESGNRPEYAAVPPSVPPDKTGLPRALYRLGAFLTNMGARTAGDDLRHLARMLAWTGQKGFLPYMGAPAAATPEAGEAMLRYHVKVAVSLLERALRGEPALPAPVLGGLSFLRRLPE